MKCICHISSMQIKQTLIKHQSETLKETIQSNQYLKYTVVPPDALHNLMNNSQFMTEKTAWPLAVVKTK